MNKLLISTLLPCVLLATIAAPAAADEGSTQLTQTKVRANSVNVSPVGWFFGSHNVNYERLVGHHGVLVEGGMVALADEDASARGVSVAVGYRWHWNGQQDSPFVGVNAGWSVGSGDSEVTEGSMTTTFDMDVSILSVVANIGKRWAWHNGFNITLRGGVGYGNYSITTKSNADGAKKAVDQLEEVFAIFPVALDGELSVGYTF